MLGIFKQLAEQLFDPDQLIQKRYLTFKRLLDSDRKSHHLLAELEKIYYGGKAVDISRLRILFDEFSTSVQKMIGFLNDLAPGQYRNLSDYYKKFDFYARFALAPPKINETPPFVLSLEKVFDDDLVAGGKGFHLAELKTKLGLPVPDGFILSTSAWNYFVRENKLREKIDYELSGVDIDSIESLQEASTRLVELIMKSPLPEELQGELVKAMGTINKSDNQVRFAVRSSAVAEDSELSFAGQYLSVLNVKPDDVGTAFRRVLSSKYSPEALFYRIINGLDDESVPMAVLVLVMVRARASGVAVTSRDTQRDFFTARIHGVKGLGDRLMAGEVIPDITELEGTTTTDTIVIRSRSTGVQCLPEDQLIQLGRYANQIDNYYRTPQEIEWSCDDAGNLYFLQTRRFYKPVDQLAEKGPVELPDLPLIFSGGETGAPGICSGTLFHLPETSRLPDVPDGSILVCQVTPPSLVALLPRLNGVIAASGSQADHFSSVAREFGIPVLLQVTENVSLLREGEEVLLHADNRQVFKGSVNLPENVRNRKQHDAESSVGRILKMVIDFTSPLSLIDPAADNFTPENCRSLHDVIRFVHEKGVQAMFLHNPDSFFRKPKTVELVSDIPLQVYLIDVGKGLQGKGNVSGFTKPADILSKPFKALWDGLSHPNINWRDHSHFDWASYDSIALAGGVAGKNDSALASYCLISADYVNVNMRFGYHFALIDCFCGELPEENYILMRFAGGGGTDIGKDLRISFITIILERIGFTCEQTGTLLDARLMRYDSQTTADRMEQIGHLLGAVRLLDMVLHDDSEVAPMVDQFFAGTYDFSHD